MLHERGALVAPAIPATLAGKCEATKTPRNRKGCAQHARGGRTRFLWLGMRQSSFTVIPYLRKPNKTQKANKTSTRCSKHAYLPPPHAFSHDLFGTLTLLLLSLWLLLLTISDTCTIIQASALFPLSILVLRAQSDPA